MKMLLFNLQTIIKMQFHFMKLLEQTTFEITMLKLKFFI